MKSPVVMRMRPSASISETVSEMFCTRLRNRRSDAAELLLGQPSFGDVLVVEHDDAVAPGVVEHRERVDQHPNARTVRPVIAHLGLSAGRSPARARVHELVGERQLIGRDELGGRRSAGAPRSERPSSWHSASFTRSSCPSGRTSAIPISDCTNTSSKSTDVPGRAAHASAACPASGGSVLLWLHGVPPPDIRSDHGVGPGKGILSAGTGTE